MLNPLCKHTKTCFLVWNEALKERDCVSPNLISIIDGIKKKRKEKNTEKKCLHYLKTSL